MLLAHSDRKDLRELGVKLLLNYFLFFLFRLRLRLSNFILLLEIFAGMKGETGPPGMTGPPGPPGF